MAICNFAGIVVGELILIYLNSKGYDWAGFAEVQGIKNKLRRALAQFTPHSWTAYRWHMLHDFRRFAYVLAVCVPCPASRGTRDPCVAAGGTVLVATHSLTMQCTRLRSPLAAPLALALQLRWRHGD